MIFCWGKTFINKWLSIDKENDFGSQLFVVFFIPKSWGRGDFRAKLCSRLALSLFYLSSSFWRQSEQIRLTTFGIKVEKKVKDFFFVYRGEWCGNHHHYIPKLHAKQNDRWVSVLYRPSLHALNACRRCAWACGLEMQDVTVIKFYYGSSSVGVGLGLPPTFRVRSRFSGSR